MNLTNAGACSKRQAPLRFWVIVWQLAAMTLGYGGLFLTSPLGTLQALGRLLPTADFWHRIAFSALRILAGFLLAVVFGVLLGAAGARWKLLAILFNPLMQLIRAMPVASFVILALLWASSSNLSIIVSFTHVLPVVYAGVAAGIADTDRQLVEMARVYRLPLGKRLRYIWMPGIFPSFCESCVAAMGMCLEKRRLRRGHRSARSQCGRCALPGQDHPDHAGCLCLDPW